MSICNDDTEKSRREVAVVVWATFYEVICKGWGKEMKSWGMLQAVSRPMFIPCCGRIRQITYWENLWSFRFSQRCCWSFNSDNYAVSLWVISEVSKGHSDYIFMVFLDCVTLKMKAIKSSETSGSIRVLFHKTCILREAAWSVVPKRREHETAALHSGRFRCLLNHYTDLTFFYL
jgi:hypothetical protein